jgi:hypothetical protein
MKEGRRKKIKHVIMEEANKVQDEGANHKTRCCAGERHTEFLGCIACSGVSKQVPYKGISRAVSVRRTSRRSRPIRIINMYEVPQHHQAATASDRGPLPSQNKDKDEPREYKYFILISL